MEFSQILAKVEGLKVSYFIILSLTLCLLHKFHRIIFSGETIILNLTISQFHRLNIHTSSKLLKEEKEIFTQAQSTAQRYAAWYTIIEMHKLIRKISAES